MNCRATKVRSLAKVVLNRATSASGANMDKSEKIMTDIHKMIEWLKESEAIATPGLWQKIEGDNQIFSGVPFVPAIARFSKEADAIMVTIMRNALPELLRKIAQNHEDITDLEKERDEANIWVNDLLNIVALRHTTAVDGGHADDRYSAEDIYNIIREDFEAEKKRLDTRAEKAEAERDVLAYLHVMYHRCANGDKYLDCKEGSEACHRCWLEWAERERWAAKSLERLKHEGVNSTDK